MPIYPFHDVVSGEYREVFMPMAQAPAIGEIVTDVKTRRELKRLPSPHQATLPDANRKFGAKWPYCSDALPRWTRPSGSDLKFDSVGRPIIRNKSHEADIASRMDMQVGGVEQWGE